MILLFTIWRARRAIAFTCLVGLISLALLVLPTAEAEQLRYHVGKSIYIDIDMTHQLQGQVKDLNKAAVEGASRQELTKIQSNITNEIYKGSVNANMSPHGLKFAVRKGQILVINDGRNFRKFRSMANPLAINSTMDLSNLALQGDMLTGGMAEGLQIFEMSDSEIGNTVGSVSLDNGELDSVENILLFGSIGTPIGGIVVKTTGGSPFHLISDFLEQEDDQILSSPYSVRKVTPAVHHP